MTERVQIIVEAKDATTGVLRAISSQFGALGNIVEDLASPTQNWGNLAASATDMAIRGMKEAVDYTVQYANEVHNLSLASGQSMEASSRFIQVLDDYGMTTQDALVATRALTKQGLAPTIDTLAKLADQYNQLGSAEEKNAFILKNLGRGGMEWANALSKGSAALRSQYEAVSQANIVTDDAYQKALEYQIAVDGLTDAWNGFKLSFGTLALPTLTAFFDDLNKEIQVTQRAWREGWATGLGLDPAGIRRIRDEVNAQYEADKASRLHTQALNDNSVAAGTNAGAIGGLTDQLKLESTARQTELSNMFAIQSASEAYASSEKSNAEQIARVKAEQIQVAAQQQKLLSQANYSMDEYNSLVAQQLDLEGQLTELQAAGDKALKDKNDSTNRLVFNMLQQKAAVDGLVSSDEEKFLMDTAVSMGLVDRASADAAISASQTADTMWNSFAKISDANSPMSKTKQLMYDMVDLDGYVVNFGVNFTTTGILGLPPELGGGGGGGTSTRNRATGGDVYAGQTYWVGERGPELFMPRQNGAIIPNGKAPAPIAIHFNAPVTVRSNDDLDYLAQEVARRIT